MKKPAAEDFAGLDNRDCCVDCDAERCVITGGPICGHPSKGALQGDYAQDRAVVDRFNRARKYLQRQAIDRSE